MKRSYLTVLLETLAREISDRTYTAEDLSAVASALNERGIYRAHERNMLWAFSEALERASKQVGE